MSNQHSSEQEHPYTEASIDDLENSAIETSELQTGKVDANDEAFVETPPIDETESGPSEVIDIAPEIETVPEPEEVNDFTSVDITILNEAYTINCPVGEEQELSDAAIYINDFIANIQKNSPQLSAKNLLVLSCLNLYDKMQKAKAAAAVDAETLQHANGLIDQMIADMQLSDSES